ncbi:MAG: DUF4251 domain-containing protein [Flavobacteriaceae bacterium]|nr:DUF4251 domain-containing protein [Flavobacteriaceae bacterium]
MKKIILTIMILLISIPILGQSKSEKKKIKEEQSLKGYAATNELIASGNFEFIADWARTQSGKRINLITNPNYLRINKDSADIYLPYFGVVHMPTAGFASEGGIVVNGIVKNYKVELNDKKQKITIKFDAKGKTDQFEFIFFVYKNKSATVIVNSNSRGSISYDGNLSEIEIKSKNK